MEMTASAHLPDNVSDFAILDAGLPELRPSDRGTPVVLRVEDIYREHFGFVWRSLRHLGVAEPDVEDAAQDVFVVVHAKLATFAHRAQLTTWIYGICIHVAQA